MQEPRASHVPPYVARFGAPLLVGMPAFLWVCDATYRASLAPLGRDQGIFQYIAWAVSRGARDYKDIRDLNGPLVHLVHFALLKIGANDEHTFRTWELGITAASFVLCGLCLPEVTAATPGDRAKRLLSRLAWGFATFTALMGQYALYIPWNQAQRESMCDWFLFPSLMLAVEAAALKDDRARRERWLTGASGALSVIAWFGKPTYALFTLAQLVALVWNDRSHLSRRDRLRNFSLGGAVGALVPFAYLSIWGDPLAYFRSQLVDVPTVYRFIWHRSAREIFSGAGPLSTSAFAIAASLAVIALVIAKELPRAVLPIALVVPIGLASIVLQGKGFDYHFHPVTAGGAFSALIVCVWIWGKRDRADAWAFSALGVACLFGFRVADRMDESPHLANVWILEGGSTPEKRADREYWDRVKSYDFFPWEMREAAAWLAANTKPTDRVQTYGMDPYLLFLAGRDSATPYIYNYDLNAAAALEGGWHYRPTDADAQNIHALRDAHEQDFLTRLEASPPRAFVFIDHAPLGSWADGWIDFKEWCPTTAAWVSAHYAPVAEFGEFHIWMRRDAEIAQ